MGKKKKVVVDTNIVVSAFGWDAKPEEILKMIEGGKLINYVSIGMLEELRRVVSYPKLKIPRNEQSEIIEYVFENSEIITPSKRVEIIKEDPSDNEILSCAIEASVDYIITGDRHLLKLKKLKDILILTPDEFLRQWG